MEASVIFGRLALTNSPIPAPASGSRGRRADHDKRDVRRDVFLARPFPAAHLRRRAGRISLELRGDAGELALLKPEFFGDRARGVAHGASLGLPLGSVAGFSPLAGMTVAAGAGRWSWRLPSELRRAG